MHKKILVKLQKLKSQFTDECTYCNKAGCMRCSVKYDFYERVAFSGLPLKYWDFEIDDLKDDIEGSSDIKNYIKKLSTAYEEGQGLFLFGKNGNGKTLSACLVGKEAIRAGYSVRFAFLGEIISAFTDAMYNAEARLQLREDILGVDFLIIDDVDKAYLSDKSSYIDSILDTLFRTRVQNCLPVIMTANKTILEILSSQEEVASKSLLSLFDESLISILFMGGDHRINIKRSARSKYLGEE